MQDKQDEKDLPIAETQAERPQDGKFIPMDEPPDKRPQDAKFAMMTETPVERLVVRMAIPTIVTMMISSLYNMADTFFVGTVGTSATAAVGISFSLMAVIQAIGFLFGQGSGNYISRQMGANDYEGASAMAATALYTSLIAGGVIAVFCLIFLEPLAVMLGSTETTMDYACDYLRYILLGAPFMTASFVLNNQLRFQGSAVYGMVGITVGAVLNIALDPLLIIVFDMEVAGAALATMISQIVSSVILFIACMRNGGISIHPRSFAPKPALYYEMIRGGMPSLLRQGLMSVATLFLNRIAGNYGDAAIAAMSISARVTMFANSALLGFGQGFQPVCGFNYGAKRYDRVRGAFWFSVKVTTGVIFAFCIVIFIFATDIVGVFRDDAEVIRIGSLALRAQSLAFPLVGWVIINNMMLQTIGKSAKASILAFARQGLFFVPFLFILTAAFGLFGLQICPPCADVATFILSVPFGKSVLAELKRDEGIQHGGV
jgi:putative MATE family efflux protein